MDDSLISFFWNDSEDFLQVSADKVLLRIGAEDFRISFSNLVSFQVQTKKKLAPLIIGAILTSLALVNIFIEGAGLSMIAFLSIGLLILYLGISDYWVVKIEKFDTSVSKWISKNKHPQFPLTLVNIISFKISKGVFPPFYAQIKKEMIDKVFSIYTNGEKLTDPLTYYLLPPKANTNYVLVKVDITKLSGSLEFVLDQPYLALGQHKINNDAIINMEV